MIMNMIRAGSVALALAGPAAHAQGQGPMMGSRPVPNLKTLAPETRVRAINYCADTYRVTTADGKMREFQERNLRFKTDSGPDGPQRGAPA